MKTFKEKLNYLYLENGHIDSLNVMKFILKLENEFKIRFSATDTHSKNLDLLSVYLKLYIIK